MNMSFAKAKFGTEGPLAFDAYIHLLKAHCLMILATDFGSGTECFLIARHLLPRFLTVQSVFTRP